MIPRPLLLASSFVLAAAGLPAAARAQRSDLLPPQRRAESVDLAARLVEPRTPPALPAELKNPFSPPGFGQPDPDEEGGVAAGPDRPRARTLRDTLEVIASHINPTGTMSLRGEPILLFGSKQTRVGDELPVTYEGTVHILVITAIERTSFTVRLNNEELTRPIKPGSKP